MPNLEAAYFRIVDRLDSVSDTTDPVELMRSICRLYDLKTTAYFGINTAHPDIRSPLLFVTYSKEWVSHYRQMRYVDLDPIVKAGFSAVLPIEWNVFDERSRRLRTFFGEAAEFGLGRTGLTFPIRGRLGDRALFTITSDASPHEWNARLHHMKRDFHVLAYHLHQKVLRQGGLDREVVRLARREAECLKWTAAGKTNDETATILSIAPKTVRCYLETARTKLGATNSTHAVAKALNQNLI